MFSLRPSLFSECERDDDAYLCEAFTAATDRMLARPLPFTRMEDPMSAFKVGDEVRAFHPRTLGVVHYGRVVKVGRKWLHVDFGPLLGGVFKVAPRDVV